MFSRLKTKETIRHAMERLRLHAISARPLARNDPPAQAMIAQIEKEAETCWEGLEALGTDSLLRNFAHLPLTYRRTMEFGDKASWNVHLGSLKIGNLRNQAGRWWVCGDSLRHLTTIPVDSSLDVIKQDILDQLAALRNDIYLRVAAESDIWLKSDSYEIKVECLDEEGNPC